MNLRATVVGLVIGLGFGAAIASLVWVLVPAGDGGDDLTAVCGMVERAAPPNEKSGIEEFRRWGGLSELMPAIVRAEPSQKPLGDALENVREGIQLFDFELVSKSVDEARAACAAR